MPGAAGRRPSARRTGIRNQPPSSCQHRNTVVNMFCGAAEASSLGPASPSDPRSRPKLALFADPIPLLLWSKTNVILPLVELQGGGRFYPCRIGRGVGGEAQVASVVRPCEPIDLTPLAISTFFESLRPRDYGKIFLYPYSAVSMEQSSTPSRRVCTFHAFRKTPRVLGTHQARTRILLALLCTIKVFPSTLLIMSRLSSFSQSSSACLRLLDLEDC